MIERLKKFYIKMFSICYSYSIKKTPVYPLSNTVLVFSGIPTLILTIVLMVYGLSFELYMGRVIKYSILLSWIIFTLLNYYYFNYLLNQAKLKTYPFEKIKFQYYLFCGFALIMLFIIVALAQASYLQNN